MRGDDADFAAYLAARWPSLVRSLVMVGCPRAEAEEVARTGLARCYGAWDRVREADDVDVHVYRTVLADWHRSRRHHRGGGVSAAPEPAPEPGLAERAALRRALEDQLSRLEPEHREAVVLRFVADLDELQLSEVLDAPVGTVRSRIAAALDGIDLVALQEILERGGDGAGQP